MTKQRGGPARLPRNLHPDDVASRLGFSAPLNKGTPYLPPLRAEVNRLPPRDQRALIEWCAAVSTDMNAARGRAGETKRVKWAKLVVVLLPRTLPLLKRIFNDRTQSESQFSLLCFLENALRLREPALTNTLERIVTRFLMTAKTNRSLSTWKAADFLGDYWPVARTIRVLSDVLMNAPAAGRHAAIGGLECVYPRASTKQRAAVRSVITAAIPLDRSPRNRFSLKWALQAMTGERKAFWSWRIKGEPRPAASTR